VALEDDARAALREYAGLSDDAAGELLGYVKKAAEREALMVIAGEEPMPSAMADLRALRLRLLFEEAKRRITPLETAVLFRLTASQAASVERRMRSTYPRAIEQFMRKLVTDTATVEPAGSAKDLRYSITFDEPAAFDYAYQLLQRAGATRDVRRKPSDLTLDCPRKIGGRDVAKDILGIA
jgi:hypothetical protein